MTKLTESGYSSSILPLILSLLAVVAVLYLCYWFSKFIAKKANRMTDTANIHILEKVALAQDKGLALAEICGSYYLVGFSNNGVEILHEVSKEDIKAQQPAFPMGGNFLEVLSSTMKHRLDVKTLDNAKPDAGDHADPGAEEEEEKQS